MGGFGLCRYLSKNPNAYGSYQQGEPAETGDKRSSAAYGGANPAPTGGQPRAQTSRNNDDVGMMNGNATQGYEQQDVQQSSHMQGHYDGSQMGHFGGYMHQIPMRQGYVQQHQQQQHHQQPVSGGNWAH